MLAETKTAREPGRILIQKDMEALFTRIGPLTETSMAFDRLKRQIGFAFVTFKTAEHETNAISALNGTSLQGRKLHLLPSIAREPSRASLQRDATVEETPRRSGQSQHQATLAEIETTQEPDSILVRNLDCPTSKKDIEVLFAKFGPITVNKMPTNNRRQTEIAFVTLGTAEQAVTTISALN